MPPDMALGAEEILGRKHMITSLLKLRMSEEMTQSELNEYISNWKMVRDRVDLLREGGLVDERLVRDGRMVMKYRLSPRGKFVSNLLLIMDMTLKGRYEVGEDGFAEIVERICDEMDSKPIDETMHHRTPIILRTITECG